MGFMLLNASWVFNKIVKAIVVWCYLPPLSRELIYTFIYTVHFKETLWKLYSRFRFLANVIVSFKKITA